MKSCMKHISGNEAKERSQAMYGRLEDICGKSLLFNYSCDIYIGQTFPRSSPNLKSLIL